MQATQKVCWCGNSELKPYGPEYASCSSCGTLVSSVGLEAEQIPVKDDDEAFYGKNYWLGHQVDDLGYTDIHQRARADLPERCMHWLQTLLRYKLPPARVLEVGCAHGGFVALMRSVGYDATGLELSPWVVDFARQTFAVPVLQGPIEEQKQSGELFDAIVLNDVVEHLPDPVGTLGECARRLKKDGILVIQMPCYPEGTSYQELLARHDRFLEQLKGKQHLNLFSRRAAKQLFEKLGFSELEFPRAIFDHYDMYLVASRSPLQKQDIRSLVPAMTSTPAGRVSLAWLELLMRHDECEVDRAARLGVIHRLESAFHATLDHRLRSFCKRILGRMHGHRQEQKAA